MTTDRTHTSVWVNQAEAIVGAGRTSRFDPGTGPDRYARALAALRESESKIAFASFTFDPDEPGSVVEIPERVDRVESTSLSEQGSEWSARITSDGHRIWQNGIDHALNAINAGVVDKVVLTRQVDIEFDTQPKIATLVKRLVDTQPGCLTFAVDGLVGASPELLVSLRDRRLTSLALAGTALESSQLTSEKMNREHSLSQSSVEEGLTPLVEKLTVEDRTVLEFGDIKHLATRFGGLALPGTTVLDVLESLHPTAAVAGAPKDTAIKLIKDLEPLSRDRYAGPVGWFDSAGEGEFAIALRCGQLRETTATLYAGGGIVAGSDPDSEFAETEMKLAPMLGALGIR